MVDIRPFNSVPFNSIPSNSVRSNSNLPNSLQIEEVQFFPCEDYSKQRKYSAQVAEVVIPYQPVDEPAWSKHQAPLAPKPARFEKLTRWDRHSSQVTRIAQWAILVAGAASVAPAVLQIVH